MDYLNDLNRQQYEAVTHTEGPLLVLAGAGSGKTRVITYRIAYLVREKQVHPERILAVTFTNKAADEMKGRVIQLLGGSASGIWINTFHAACVRILRAEIRHLGYRQDFAVLDGADQLRLVRECVEELKINRELYDPKEIARRISRLKNRIIIPEVYGPQCPPFGIEEKVARVYPLYQKRLKALNGLDFDDLLMAAVLLFEGHAEVLRRYQERFRYMMIDEYQDTNHAQYRLVRLLAGHGNVCVVGDDDQSIYGFRGADLENLLSFEKDFPRARVIRLEQNYRSTQTILGAAGTVVGKNRKRKAKKLWTQNPGGSAVTVCRVGDEEAEARYIGKEIKNMVGGGDFDYRDIAILYRTHAQSRALEEGLRDGDIPYRILGGLRFYERMEIKDLLAYLRVVARPDDELSLKRILNVPPRGIGQVTVERLEALAREKGMVLSLALAGVLRPSGLDDGLSPAQKKNLAQFAALIEEFRQAAVDLSLTGLVKLILVKTGYEQMLRQEAAEGSLKGEARSRLENIQELCSATQVFEERHSNGSDSMEPLLAAFLDHVALLTDSSPEAEERTGAGDPDTSPQNPRSRGAVLLMTCHSSKGLEFPAVILAGMEEGLFPHQSALSDPDQIEEERRLCYVAMTRAKKVLQMVHAERRRLYGSIEYGVPSRFIADIPAGLVNETEWNDRFVATVRQPAGSPAQAAEVQNSSGPFSVGSQVRHPMWGVGLVRVTEGNGADQRVVVQFKSVGTKKLAVSHARLEEINSLSAR